jgi:hypothetical protein
MDAARESHRRQEVAVMRNGTRSVRAGRVWRRWVVASLGFPLTGCAGMTQSVDAYYRQMAVNYQEAIDKAKLDETSLENQSRVLLTTGDQSKYHKTQRELASIRSWEKHCAWEKERFDKAAKWMESHFHIEDMPKVEGAVAPAAAAATRPVIADDTLGHNTPETPTD